MMNKQSNRVTKFTANNFWSGRWQDGDLSELPLQDAIGADSDQMHFGVRKIERL